MKALGVREGPGSMRRDWAGPGPGLGRHLGVLGLGRLGPTAPEALVVRRSLWAGSVTHMRLS